MIARGPRGRRFRGRRFRRLRRHPYLLAVCALGALVAMLLGGWLVFDLLAASRDLQAVSDSLGRAQRIDTLIEAEGRQRLALRLEDAHRRAVAANRRLRGSVPLKVAGMLPNAAFQRRGLLLLSGDAVTSIEATQQTLARIDELAGTNRIEGARLPLDAMERLEVEARTAGQTMKGTVRRSASLAPGLKDARDRYDAKANDIGERLLGAADALAVVRSFAAQGGSRRHLVVGLNNAELRDQGMALSYAVIQFDDGRFHVVRSGPITDLRLGAPTPTVVPEGATVLFSALEPTRVWQSVNATADFGWSGTAMLDMYQSATGERLDGVIAMDVPALARLLSVIGPVRPPGIDQQVSAGNVNKLLMSDMYAQLPPGADQGPRREAVAAVARATADAIAASPQDPVRLARALSAAAAGRHLRLHSPRPEEQATFERLGLGGAPAPSADLAARTFHYSVQNATGTKLDYHQRHVVRFDVDTTEAGNAVVRTTVRVANGAPADAQPSYAFGPTFNQQRAGQYAGRVYLWGPAGSQQFESVDESGLRASSAVIVADPQTEATAGFETLLKGGVRSGRLALRLVPQPLVVPARVEIVVDGRMRLARVWDRTLDLRLAV